jgi:hypothetical protein
MMIRASEPPMKYRRSAVDFVHSVVIKPSPFRRAESKFTSRAMPM